MSLASAVDSTQPRDQARVERLLSLAVGNGHDAFADVPWDDPDHALEPTDPRLRLWHFDPLAWTDWYRAQPADRQAEVGLLRFAHNMRVGWEFENLLQQGLLTRAFRMDNEDRRFAFVHHEIVEESQHSMMFHEFARRHAPEVVGMSPLLRGLGDVLVQASSRRLTALFYFLVLGGELPVDHLQRRALREQPDLHPLVRRILKIHVEEEARHVSFANLELRRLVPEMSATERHALALGVPPLMGIMARMMVLPSERMTNDLGVPARDVAAMKSNPLAKQLLKDSVLRVRSLCHELGLMTPPARAAWMAAGLWDAPRSSRAAA